MRYEEKGNYTCTMMLIHYTFLFEALEIFGNRSHIREKVYIDVLGEKLSASLCFAAHMRFMCSPGHSLTPGQEEFAGRMIGGVCCERSAPNGPCMIRIRAFALVSTIFEAASKSNVDRRQ